MRGREAGSANLFEQAGTGRLLWAWVFVCEETAAVLARSEPMFKSKTSALRVGNQVMHAKRNRFVSSPGTHCRPSHIIQAYH